MGCRNALFGSGNGRVRPSERFAPDHLLRTKTNCDSIAVHFSAETLCSGQLASSQHTGTMTNGAPFSRNLLALAALWILAPLLPGTLALSPSLGLSDNNLNKNGISVGE